MSCTQLSSRISKNVFVGEFRRVSTSNFSAYLDKVGVTQAKKKIALNETASFSNIITLSNNEVKIVTKIQYGVDIGTTTTEAWYIIQGLLFEKYRELCAAILGIGLSFTFQTFAPLMYVLQPNLFQKKHFVSADIQFFMPGLRHSNSARFWPAQLLTHLSFVLTWLATRKRAKIWTSYKWHKKLNICRKGMFLLKKILL